MPSPDEFACAIRESLDREQREGNASGDAKRLIATLEARQAHVRDCPVCRPTADLLARRLAPAGLSQYLPGLSGRLVRFVEQGLPRPMRVPHGREGDARRASLFAAQFYSLVSIGRLALGAAFHRISWSVALEGAIGVTLTAFVGFFLAGWVMDLARPWQDRFLGCLIGGAVAAGTLYAVFVGVVLLSDPAWQNALIYLPWALGAGAAAGAILWVWDRINAERQR